MSKLANNRLFLFYETKECPVLGFLNEEITAEGLGDLALEKGVNLYILKEPKSAKYYRILKDGQIEHCTLFILGNNLVIQKIYQGICEEEIVQLLEGID